MPILGTPASGGTMEAPYYYYDPENPPPMRVTIAWFMVLFVVLIVCWWWDRTHDASPDEAVQVSTAPTPDEFHGYPRAVVLQLARTAPTHRAEIGAVISAARNGDLPMNIARPTRMEETQKSTEGFSFTRMRWQCSATDFGTLQSVLEVSFATEGAFGFTLASTTDPAPQVYIMPTPATDNVGIIGFNNPDERRMYIATYSDRSEVINGWQVLGYVDLPAPLAAGWCGYNGVFRLSSPDGLHVDGRASVNVHDPNEDLLR